MIVLEGDFQEWEARPEPTWCTIGTFDGVHLGHQAVIDALAVHSQGRPVGVITFRQHPLTVLHPGDAPPLLTSVEQRLELLEGRGVDVVALVDFEQVQDMAAEDFIAEIVARVMRAAHLAVGSGFRFGHGGTGDENLLRRLGGRYGFEVEILDIVGDDAPIRSTAIRHAIAAGDVAAAAAMLGRPYQLVGSVVQGDQRGRSLGFPTANLELEPGRAMPGRGVYAAFTRIGRGEPRQSVVNVGVRPTFDGSAEVVEVHLLDTDQDLYGQELRVDFVDRIRPERRFNGIESLVAQIDRDIRKARAQLASSLP